MMSAALLSGSIATPSKLLSPYPASIHPTSSLFVISSQGRSPSELVCLDSFAGLLARQTPRVYRVADTNWEDPADSRSSWLRVMRTHGVRVNTSLLNASVPLVIATVAAAASQALPGYVLANGATKCKQDESAKHLTVDRTCGPSSVWSWESSDSISAGLTMAAAMDGLIVAADSELAAGLDAVGVKQHADVRTQKVGDVLRLSGVLSNLSSAIYIWQDAAKASFLGDYAVFARAASLPFGAEPSAQAMLLGARSRGTLGAAFGWGPENAYVSTCNAAGVYVHASDFCTNLAALSNAHVPVPAPHLHTDAVGGDGHRIFTPTPAMSKHTVAFVMSDGDNLQWLLGPWSTDQRWWGSRQRGGMPLGWTLSPALGSVAPPALSLIAGARTVHDELVGAPSGVGYVFPQTWPAGSRDPFVALTAAGMAEAGMRVVNVLGQNDDPPDGALLAQLLAQDGIDGALYYPFGGGYSALGGRMWRLGGKLVLSGRLSLWGNASSGSMLGVQPLIDALLALPRNPSSADGYSVVPVHAWSHSYADVATVAAALEASGGVDVVAPSELLRRVGRDAWAVGCTCDTPGKGAAGHNGYTCSDGTRAFCASDQACFATLEFAKGDWRSGCGATSSVQVEAD